MADFFTVAVRTGGEGAEGISVVLVERERPGISVRKMETQFDSCHGTTFITFDAVRVPVANLIGAENHGFQVRCCVHAVRGCICAGSAGGATQAVPRTRTVRRSSCSTSTTSGSG